MDSYSHNQERSLQRVYLEVTNRCNLSCRACIRNVWEMAAGRMKFEHFQHILQELQRIQPPPSLFFGGYGEPLIHPRILEMVELAGERGFFTELITNGTLLTTGLAAGLAERGLDRLWVSIDGSSPERYSEIRTGDHLTGILHTLRETEMQQDSSPAVGIAMVLMKKNLEDLPGMLSLCREIGADDLFVSHLEAHTRAMDRETLYRDQLIQPSLPHNSRVDYQLQAIRSDPLLSDRSPQRIRKPGGENSQSTCPFVDRGAVAVRWDGKVSPCLPLLYQRVTHVGSWERWSEPYHAGDLMEQPLTEIWMNPEFTALRRNLEEKTFSPCADCRDCWFSDSNQQDCMGHGHPTCGGCLWAAGWIACP